MLEVKNLEELHAIQNPGDHELVKVGENDYYTFIDGEWKNSKENMSIKLSLYDINKQMLARNEAYTKEQIEESLSHFFTDHPSNYYMLLNNEFRYYTMFVTGKGGKSVTDEAVDLLMTSFDKVVDIAAAEGGLEIWAYRKEAIGLYILFDYTMGVIECL